MLSNGIQDNALTLKDWVDFMEQHEAFGIKSITKDRQQVFMIVLQDGMSMFCRQDYEAVVLVWDRMEDFEELDEA